MRHTNLGLALAAPLLVLALGACSGSAEGADIATVQGAKPSASTTASAAPEDAAEQGRKFAQCMRDNGVDMPDPEPGQGMRILGGAREGDRAAFQAAMEKCRSLLPNGGARAALDPERLDQLREFAKCMRDNGVDMPDPDPNGGDFALSPGGVDRESPTFQKALEACEDKRPQRLVQSQ